MGFQGYIYIGCRSGSIYKQKRWRCRNRFTLFTTLSRTLVGLNGSSVFHSHSPSVHSMIPAFSA